MQWNPQHFWLATIADSSAGGGISPTLYLSDLQGHQLLVPRPVNAQDLAWSPDGTQLGLVDQNGDVMLLRIQQLSVDKLTITRTITLKAGTTTDEGLAWSPSGHWIVCRHGSYQSEDYLFLLATDGSGKQVKLTSSTTDGQLAYPAWSPDGKQLIVSQVSDGSLMSLDIASLLKQKDVTP